MKEFVQINNQLGYKSISKLRKILMYKADENAKTYLQTKQMQVFTYCCKTASTMQPFKTLWSFTQIFMELHINLKFLLPARYSLHEFLWKCWKWRKCWFHLAHLALIGFARLMHCNLLANKQKRKMCRFWFQSLQQLLSINFCCKCICNTAPHRQRIWCISVPMDDGWCILCICYTAPVCSWLMNDRVW